MLSEIVLAVTFAGTTMMPCGNSHPLVARNYIPRPILTATEAISAARIQIEEFGQESYRHETTSLRVWLRTYQAKRFGAEWVVQNKKLDLNFTQIHLDAATGWLKCSILFD